VFEATVSKYSGDRVVLYSLKEYQEKLRKHHERKVKALVVIEGSNVFTATYKYLQQPQLMQQALRRR